MKSAVFTVGLILLASSGARAVETESPRNPPAETAPQSSASTTVKAPAGVTSPDTATGKPGCRTASAEMTNGATDTCKK